MPNIESKSHNVVHQWASRVISFSSEYNNTTWAADKCLGPPRVYPNYGDLQNTWAQSNANLEQNFIELGFPIEVYVSKINIFETYHAGAITSVKLRNKKTATWVTVWESSVGAQNIEASRIFSPELPRATFKTNEIRLELDCSVASSYCEIDAVELIGKKQMVDFYQTEQTLRENLAKLLVSEELCDVKFRIGDKYVSAHRNILIARSDYFRIMLCESLSDERLKKPIFINNASYDAFKALLYFLYTDNVFEKSSVETVCELARLSEWYNISDLKAKCFEFLKVNLSIENVISLFLCSVSIEPKLEDIEDVCLRFIAKNFAQIIERDEFKKLPQNYMIQITQFYAQFQ